MKQSICLILLLLGFMACISQTGNSSPPKMTPADSAALFQQEVNKFVDSLISKTTLKEFVEFLYINTTGKQANEEKWTMLYDFFVRTKANQWAAEREKKRKPPGKN
jgi:predicted HTH transcriptional regulator